MGVAALALAFPAAGVPMQPAPFDGKGTLVFSCSGCRQHPSGPSLYVVKADGTGFRKIETPHLSPYGPRWSPNGRRISLSSRFTDIWTIDAAGRSARRLTHACVECDYPPAAWSPDGSRLAFPRQGRIFTMNSDGTRQRRLLGRGRPGFSEPDWSPDGKRIAFDQHGDRLWVVRANGRAPTKLRRVSGRYPRWSPSGKWIAFIGFTGRGAALMVVRADGTHPRILYMQENLEINSSPAWSPDGRYLVFAIRHRVEQGGSRYDGHEFLVTPLDGAAPRPIAIPELPPDAYSELYGVDWR